MFNMEMLQAKTAAEISEILSKFSIKLPKNATAQTRIFAILDFQASNKDAVNSYFRENEKADSTEVVEKIAPAKRGRKKQPEPETATEETPEANAEETPEIPTKKPTPKSRGRKKAETAEAAEIPAEENLTEEKSEETVAEKPQQRNQPKQRNQNNRNQKPAAETQPEETAENTEAPKQNNAQNRNQNQNQQRQNNQNPQRQNQPQNSQQNQSQNSQNNRQNNNRNQQNSAQNENSNNQNPQNSQQNNNRSQEREEEKFNFDGMVEIEGVLEILPDNYGFLRSPDFSYISSPDDVYVSTHQIRNYGLKTGDTVKGIVRLPKEGEKYFSLQKPTEVNGRDLSFIKDRVAFEFLTPLFPQEKFNLAGKGSTVSTRIVDLFAPIGKGQRAMIVAQPKTGKTMLLKDIANAISENHPEAYMMVLLIDERPEEVTDMERSVNAEVIASTFDEAAEKHVKVANLVLAKAQRMVECGHDVVILLDSITRLARAYNTVTPASGKILSGGVDANALHRPKRFFGAARKIEGGGSLTIIATALIDTGSKMDEVIFEEFKGTGNMELQLDRKIANKRIYPAIDLVASSTRRDDLLMDEVTQQRMWILRKHLSDMNPMEAMEFIQKNIKGTLNNEEFLMSMNK